MPSLDPAHLRRLGAAAACVAVAGALAPAVAPAAAPRSSVSIASPRAHTPVAAGTLKVLARTSGKVRALKVDLDGRDVTGAARAGPGRVRVNVRARAGRHYLRFSWRDGRGRRRTTARQFVAGRSAPALVRVTAARRSAGLVRLRVKLARGVRDVQVLVNGRRTELPGGGGVPRTVTVALGARHGVRFGANRVVVIAHRPARAQQDRDTLHVTVTRGRPLAGGLERFRGVAGRATRLDARWARAARGGRLSFRWRVVSKPRGAHVKISGAGSARPRVRGDRPGRYRLAVTVRERGVKPAKPRTGRGGRRSTRRAVAARATTLGSTRQVVTLMSGATPVHVAGQWLGGSNPINGLPAFTLDNVQYVAGDDHGPALLALDADTLAPLTTYANLGGSATSTYTIPLGSGSTPDQQILASLAGVAGVSSDPMLVLIVSNPSGNQGTTLIDPTNAATYLFAYDSSRSDYGLSSGWSAVAATADDDASGQLTGWLTRGYAEQNDGGGSTLPTYGGGGAFTFSPGPQQPFDTQAATGAGTNTMSINGQQVTATLPNGATNGFQLVTIAPRQGDAVTLNNAYDATNGGQMAQFANDLQAQRNLPNATIFVQSIGSPKPVDGSWDAAAAQLNAIGGLTGGFVGLADVAGATSYALVATVGVDAVAPKPGVSTASGVTVAEATPVLNGAGVAGGGEQLTGFLTPTAHSGLAPAATAQVDGSGVGLYGALAAAPQISMDPFDSPDEQAALTAMQNTSTSLLSDAFGTACYPGADASQLTLAQLVRGNYCDTALHWSTWASMMAAWAQGGTPPPSSYRGDVATFQSVASELNIEFTAVDEINDFATFQNAIVQAQADVLTPTQQSADAVLTAVTTLRPQPPGHTGSYVSDGFSIVSSILAGASALTPAFPAVGIISGIAGVTSTAISIFDESRPPQPQPTQVDPSTLIPAARGELEAMSAGLRAAADRISNDPAKLVRAANNLANASSPTLDPLPEYAGDWSATNQSATAFDQSWTVGVQTQLGTQYVGSALGVWRTPRAISNVYDPTKDASTLRCGYEWSPGIEKHFSPFHGSQPYSSFLPRDRWAQSNVWTLWSHGSPELNPFNTGPADHTRTNFGPTQQLMTQLTAAPPTGWGIAPAAIFLTSGATQWGPNSVEWLTDHYDGCDWGEKTYH